MTTIIIISATATIMKKKNNNNKMKREENIFRDFAKALKNFFMQILFHRIVLETLLQRYN